MRFFFLFVKKCSINCFQLSSFQNWMSDLEIFTSLMAAIIHDFDHTGTTNNFHVQSTSELAVLYNDKSVLENHHVAAFFRSLGHNTSYTTLLWPMFASGRCMTMTATFYKICPNRNTNSSDLSWLKWSYIQVIINLGLPGMKESYFYIFRYVHAFFSNKIDEVLASDCNCWGKVQVERF